MVRMPPEAQETYAAPKPKLRAPPPPTVTQPPPTPKPSPIPQEQPAPTPKPSPQPLAPSTPLPTPPTPPTKPTPTAPPPTPKIEPTAPIREAPPTGRTPATIFPYIPYQATKEFPAPVRQPPPAGRTPALITEEYVGYQTAVMEQQLRKERGFVAGLQQPGAFMGEFQMEKPGGGAVEIGRYPAFYAGSLTTEVGIFLGAGLIIGGAVRVAPKIPLAAQRLAVQVKELPPSTRALISRVRYPPVGYTRWEMLRAPPPTFEPIPISRTPVYHAGAYIKQDVGPYVFKVPQPRTILTPYEQDIIALEAEKSAFRRLAAGEIDLSKTQKPTTDYLLARPPRTFIIDESLRAPSAAEVAKMKTMLPPTPKVTVTTQAATTRLTKYGTPWKPSDYLSARERGYDIKKFASDLWQPKGKQYELVRTKAGYEPRPSKIGATTRSSPEYFKKMNEQIREENRLFTEQIQKEKVLAVQAEKVEAIQQAAPLRVTAEKGRAPIPIVKQPPPPIKTTPPITAPYLARGAVPTGRAAFPQPKRGEDIWSRISKAERARLPSAEKIDVTQKAPTILTQYGLMRERAAMRSMARQEMRAEQIAARQQQQRGIQIQKTATQQRAAVTPITEPVVTQITQPITTPIVTTKPKLTPTQVTPPQLKQPTTQRPRQVTPPTQVPRLITPPTQVPRLVTPPTQVPRLITPPTQVPRLVTPPTQPPLLRPPLTPPLAPPHRPPTQPPLRPPYRPPLRPPYRPPPTRQPPPLYPPLFEERRKERKGRKKWEPWRFAIFRNIPTRPLGPKRSLTPGRRLI